MDASCRGTADEDPSSIEKSVIVAGQLESQAIPGVQHLGPDLLSGLTEPAGAFSVRGRILPADERHYPMEGVLIEDPDGGSNEGQQDPRLMKTPIGALASPLESISLPA